MRFESITLIPAAEDPAETAQRALPIVVGALELMLARKKSLRPFLILHDVATEKFVQWAGSSEERLLFDVPALEISEREPEGQLDLVACASRGLTLLHHLCTESSEPDFARGLRLEQADSHDPELPLIEALSHG